MSSHAFVSAALSWTLRFLRNHTAVVVMALTDASVERMRSDVVVLKCSLSWLMRSLLSARRQRLRVLLFVASGLRTSRVSVSQAQSE